VNVTDWVLLFLIVLTEIEVVTLKRRFDRALLMQQIKHTMFVEEMRHTLKKEKE
jgi:hypothetical protein